MKRIGLVFLIMALVPFSLLAQNTGQQSLQQTSSFSVFHNEMDAALSVDETGYGPGFSELSSKYLFGGLANLNLLDNRDGVPSSPGAPIWMGMYKPGEMPWSLFTGLHFGDFTQTAPVITSGATSSKNPTGTDITYNWVDDQAVNTPKSRLFSAVNANAQYLMRLAGLNTGLYLGYSATDAAAYSTGSNYVEVETFYFDAQGADAAVAPDVEVGYATTEENSTFDLSSDIRFGVPLFLQTGDMAHLFNLSGTLDMGKFGSDDSFAYGSTNAAYDAAVTDTAFTARDTDVRSTFDVDAMVDYELTLPPLVGEGSDNEFKAMADASLILKTASADVYTETRDVEFTVGGSWEDRLDTTDRTVVTTRPALGFDIGAGASHSFYYVLADTVTFGVVPEVELGFRSEPEFAYIESTLQTFSEDNEDNGNFTAAADLITTNTATFTNVSYDAENDTAQAQEITNTVSSTVRLPASVMIQPEGWFFGFTVGAEPEVGYTWTKTKTAGTATSTTNEVLTGTGTVDTALTQNNPPSTPEYSSIAHDWTVRADHRFGMNLMFPGGVKADVWVNFTNILELDDLTAQLIIPLP